MAKYNNTFDWGGGFNIKGESPIDSRMVVDNINDLYNPQTWNENNTPKYQGMPVVVLEDNSIYILKDVNNFDIPFGKTKIDIDTHTTRSSGWAKITGLTQKDIKELLDIEIENRKLADVNVENKIVGEKTSTKGEIFNDYTYNKALGTNSHAEGSRTTVKGWCGHAEGANTISDNDCAHAEGMSTQALFATSHAEGKNTKALNEATHAEGVNTTANGLYSHAEGFLTTANNSYTHAEGWGTITNNIAEHAEGKYNLSTSNVTLSSIGYGANNARKNAVEVSIDGLSYFSGIGNYNGININTAKSLQEVINNKANNNDIQDFITGNDLLDWTPGNYSTDDLGFPTGEIFNDYQNNQANALNSHAEGYSNIISENGENSHAEGSNNNITAANAHTEGTLTVANGENSHTEGIGTITNNDSEHAQGKYNISNNDIAHNKFTLSSIGFGDDDSNRKNAIEVLNTGYTYLYGIGNYDGSFYLSTGDYNPTIKSLQEIIIQMQKDINDLKAKIK